MNEEIKEHILCEECGEEYDVIHNEESEIVFCPFCGSEILYDEMDEDEDDFYEEDEYDS